MEVEAKFVLPDAETFRRLQAVDRLAGFALSAAQVKEVRDTYLDTSERAILAAGYACRQREQDEDLLITLKGLGGAEGAVHRREELEILLPADAPPADWPPSPVRDQVIRLIGDASLIPLFHLQQTRIIRLVGEGERPVAELSLDDVLLIAGGREWAFLELEVELAPGAGEDDLAAVATCLEDEWGLEPMRLSKFERALAVLEEVGSEGRLLAARERAVCGRIAAREDRYGRWAQALLALDERTIQVEAGERAGVSDRTVRRWLTAFRQERMDIFPARVLAEAMPVPPASSPEARGPVEPWPLEQLFEEYGVDTVHARAVADFALALFDHLLPFHGLPPERRSLLDVAALVHNVGLEADPDRHDLMGRDILLAHPPARLDDDERRIVALTTLLHRKRITPKKLDKLAREPCFADLPAPLRTEALAIAALVRMADGLDYNQTGSSRLEGVHQRGDRVEFEVAGPSAEADAKRAQAKSDLWHLLFEMDLQFKASGMLVRTAGALMSEVTTLLKQPGLEADDSMAEAARKTFLFHFQRMLYHEPGTRLGEDIEELHDMRVATRRMRAAFRVFGDYLDMAQMRPFIKGLRRTGRTLGAVRDLDVFWEKTQRYLDGLPPSQQGGLDPLRAVWEAERERARGRMLVHLDSDRYVRFRERFGEFLQTPSAGALPVLSENGEPVPHRLRHVVPVTIHQRLAAVRAYDEWVTGPDVPLERLHRLRIAAKGLRYAVEYFEEVLGPEAKDLIQEMKALQDHLGDLQDGVVASNLLRDFLTWGTWGHAQAEGRDLSLPTETIVAPGVAAYLTARQTELQHLLNTFPQAWAQIRSPEFNQLVTGALATL